MRCLRVQTVRLCYNSMSVTDKMKPSWKWKPGYSSTDIAVAEGEVGCVWWGGTWKVIYSHFLQHPSLGTATQNIKLSRYRAEYSGRMVLSLSKPGCLNAVHYTCRHRAKHTKRSEGRYYFIRTRQNQQNEAQCNVRFSSACHRPQNSRSVNKSRSCTASRLRTIDFVHAV